MLVPKALRVFVPTTCRDVQGRDISRAARYSICSAVIPFFVFFFCVSRNEMGRFQKGHVLTRSEVDVEQQDGHMRTALPYEMRALSRNNPEKNPFQ